MTGRTTLGLKRRVLKDEGPLLIGVTLNTSDVGAKPKAGLLILEAAVRVVAVAAFHRALQHFVMERLRELRLRFRVAANTELRLALLQHRDACHSCVLMGSFGDEAHRIRLRIAEWGAVRAVTVGTTDVIAPMLSTPEVVVVLFTRVACKTSFGDLFRVLSFEGNYLRRIGSVLHVSFARTVTLFAAHYLVLPAMHLSELSVLCRGEILELVLMTGLTCFAADIVAARRRRCGRRCGCVNALIDPVTVNGGKGAGGPESDERDRKCGHNARFYKCYGCHRMPPGTWRTGRSYSILSAGNKAVCEANHSLICRYLQPCVCPAMILSRPGLWIVRDESLSVNNPLSRIVLSVRVTVSRAEPIISAIC